MVLTPLTFCEPGGRVVVKADHPGYSMWERCELGEGRKKGRHLEGRVGREAGGIMTKLGVR